MSADEEAQARDVLVTVAVRIAYVSIGEVRRCIDLGPRWPKVLPDGYYNYEPMPEDETAKDIYAWSIIRELVKFGLFFTLKEEADRDICDSSFDSPARREFEGDGIQIDKGPLSIDLSGHYVRSPTHSKEMRAALKSRRPSKSFIEAYRTYRAPILQAEQALAALPSADYSALVRYIRSGAELEPDAWSLEDGVRLEPVTWDALAKALAEVGVPFGRGGILYTGKNWLGRERSYVAQGWILATVFKEGSRGNYDQVTRLLLPDGLVLDRKEGPERFAGKPHPTQIRDLVRRHRGGDDRPR